MVGGGKACDKNYYPAYNKEKQNKGISNFKTKSIKITYSQLKLFKFKYSFVTKPNVKYMILNCWLTILINRENKITGIMKCTNSNSLNYIFFFFAHNNQIIYLEQ